VENQALRYRLSGIHGRAHVTQFPVDSNEVPGRHPVVNYRWISSSGTPTRESYAATATSSRTPICESIRKSAHEDSRVSWRGHPHLCGIDLATLMLQRELACDSIAHQQNPADEEAKHTLRSSACGIYSEGSVQRWRPAPEGQLIEKRATTGRRVDECLRAAVKVRWPEGVVRFQEVCRRLRVMETPRRFAADKDKAAAL